MSDPRLLLITRNSWSNEISTGNTMSNFFSGWKHDIANVFCRDEKINNEICKRYYRITERELIRSIFSNNEDIGTEIILDDINKVFSSETDQVNMINEKRKYDFFKAHRLQIFLWMRELIWKFGKWRNYKLNNFLKDYNPNILLMPMYDCHYMYDLLFYMYEITRAKVVLYTGDDVYSMKKLSISPLYWIDCVIRRGRIRKAVAISDFRFCLTDKQSREYSNIFGKDFLFIPKSIKRQNISIQRINTKPINMVYTGNILHGRYKILGEIGKAMEKINRTSTQLQLHIYTNNSLITRGQRCLDHENVYFHGSVSSEEVDHIINNADIVIHVEDFTYSNRQKVRLSFSTKIVDYISKAKCIFAVGPVDVASIEYLLENDAAIVSTTIADIEAKLNILCKNPSLISEYSIRALKCGNQNHLMNNIQELLYTKLSGLVTE